MTHTIQINGLNELLSFEKSINLLDVRRKEDYRNTPKKITGALWQDPEKIETWMNQMKSDYPTVVYCVKGGSVSRSVTEHLRKQGLDAVFLEGGLKAWIDSGNSVEDVRPANNSYAIQATDIALLRKSGVTEDDIAHSLNVAGKALEIAERVNKELDMELVGRGALFHDLGKAKTHAMEHGKLGAEMGKALGLPDAVTTVMEKHIRGGLSIEEAIELNLPEKDYTLYKLEERIIIYADRLVDIITEGIVPIREEREAEKQFEEILRTIPKYGKNEKTLKRYLNYHQEIQSLMS